MSTYRGIIVGFVKNFSDTKPMPLLSRPISTLIHGATPIRGNYPIMGHAFYRSFSWRVHPQQPGLPRQSRGCLTLYIMLHVFPLQLLFKCVYRRTSNTSSPLLFYTSLVCGSFTEFDQAMFSCQLSLCAFSDSYI